MRGTEAVMRSTSSRKRSEQPKVGFPAARLQQFIQLLDQPAEMGEGRVDRAGLLHVDAGVAQQVERNFEQPPCRN